MQSSWRCRDIQSRDGESFAASEKGVGRIEALVENRVQVARLPIDDGAE